MTEMLLVKALDLIGRYNLPREADMIRLLVDLISIELGSAPSEVSKDDEEDTVVDTKIKLKGD